MREIFKNAEDFASDPDFRNWVLNPNPQRNYYWENWIKEHPELKETIHQARVIVLTFYNKAAQVNSGDNKLWEQIEKTVNKIDSKKEKRTNGHLVVNFPNDHKYSKTNRRVKLLTGIAASIIGIMVIAYTFYDEIKLNLQAETAQPTPAKIITKSVVKGQKLKMFLSDGSIVHLNASSKIKFKEHFSEKERIVWLEGEAFFDVKKDPSRPFIVKCKDLETKVLGTTFNIKSYPDDKTTSVALLSGKVQVKNLKKEGEVTLKPGEQADLNVETGEIVSGQVKNPLELQWKDGVLAFKQEPLYKVFEKLELWYGVEFRIEGLSCDKKVTGVFKNEYLSNVLQSLRYTVNFEFEIDDDIVYVKG